LNQTVIHILDKFKGALNHKWPRPLSDWYPLWLNRNYLKEYGFVIRLFNQIIPKINDCDVLLLSSRFFHIENKCNKEKENILQTIKMFNNCISKVIWFDQRDSSGNSQFEVLPFVSKYLKNQLLKNTSLYEKEMYGNRIYTDYYHSNNQIIDSYCESQEPLLAKDKHKLGLSWNIGLANINGMGMTYFSRNLYQILGSLGIETHYLKSNSWKKVSREREIDIFAKFGMNYDRNTVGFQRKMMQSYLKNINSENSLVGENNISLNRYRKSIISSKITISPFGWGEICYRDFETFINGSVLLKPDVSHLRTWPKFFKSFDTYYPIKWDLSDLSESIETLLDRPTLRLELAESGQNMYKWYWCDEGKISFCERFKSIIST